MPFDERVSGDPLRSNAATGSPVTMAKCDTTTRLSVRRRAREVRKSKRVGWKATEKESCLFLRNSHKRNVATSTSGETRSANVLRESEKKGQFSPRMVLEGHVATEMQANGIRGRSIRIRVAAVGARA